MARNIVSDEYADEGTKVRLSKAIYILGNPYRGTDGKRVFDSDVFLMLKTLGLQSLFQYKSSAKEKGYIKEIATHSVHRVHRSKFEEIREAWRVVLAEIELTNTNSSSLACDSLIKRIESGRSLESWGELRPIRYYKGGETRLISDAEEFRKALEKAADRVSEKVKEKERKKRLYKMKREMVK